MIEEPNKAEGNRPPIEQSPNNNEIVVKVDKQDCQPIPPQQPLYDLYMQFDDDEPKLLLVNQTDFKVHINPQPTSDNSINFFDDAAKKKFKVFLKPNGKKMI